MTRINNYDDLVAERIRTKLLIEDRKQIIQDRIEDITNKVEPIFSVLSALNVFKKNDSGSGNHSALRLGSALAIDLFVGQKLLKNAGWLTRLLVPTLLKTISAGVIGVKKRNES
jgi:hypothetical protein